MRFRSWIRTMWFRTSAAAGPSSSPYFSERIQSLIERRSNLGSEVEFEIETSKSHWTETSVAASIVDGGEQRAREEEQRVANIAAFEKLKKHRVWGPSFRRQPYELEIGARIAKGGQAEIFEALGTNGREDTRYLDGKTRLVLKVFNKGFSLEDVQKLLPAGLASAALPYRYFPRKSPGKWFFSRYGLCWSVGAQLLDDGRFAFVFDRYWGDLRKLIDKRKLESNRAPPFSLKETYTILGNIAKGMVTLHNCGLLHKDLKAANVLTVSEAIEDGVHIADFESTVGIKGTGFWRAPEVLLALQNRRLKEKTFTQQSDVYSYAMTCYEVLTGRVPFEGHPIYDYDIVLRGERPALPDDIPLFFKTLVRKCWHEDPLQRLSFQEIVAGFTAYESQVQADLLHRYQLLSDDESTRESVQWYFE